VGSVVLLVLAVVAGYIPAGRRSWIEERQAIWYSDGMKTTIDRAGRVVLPAAIRSQLGLAPGTELEVRVEDYSVRLTRAVAGPKIVRCGDRLVARPTLERAKRRPVEVAHLIEEERDRWLG
jgi:AbrB family looped-hinge helix DNA binding protein